MNSVSIFNKKFYNLRCNYHDVNCNRSTNNLKLFTNVSIFCETKLKMYHLKEVPA